MVEVRMRVNGATATLDIEPQVSLLDALREHLGLTGAKKGCAQGACGACTVLADGERIVSCLALAVQYEEREITTVEGLADGERLHPLQAAFIAHDGLQCGYCTPGQLCSAIGMLAEHRAGAPSAVTEPPAARDRAAGLPEAELSEAELSEAEIRERMSGNLCRCGAYNGIVAAIRDVAAMGEETGR
ncbi:(2Fe-2S)-binding protein [Nonomuraea sp. NPDC047897]|uniref:(2Fe-2S)-binding protein n=1 Tax=Nonomuraea sp. NPDC047897 TaxID=3364346 RepID=UPI0037164D83